ncbi:MAG: hypothetical protein H0U74_03425 [Bradymonadaceae bacterium]|nr:hypothetical protein [Lujinxingiaceae bacterium]
MNPHFKLLEQAHKALSSLGHPFVFLGGATVSLHVDDPASGPVRATKDVDLVVEVAGYGEFATVEEQLRRIGFEQSFSDDGAPICRWKKDDLILDVLPTEPQILGFGRSDWFRQGFREARSFELPSGITIQAFGPIHLLAAKIEAFEDRGGGDWLLSQDIEDIATLLDGRTTIFAEIEAQDAAATFVRQWLKGHTAELLDAVAGHTNDFPRARYLVGNILALQA